MQRTMSLDPLLQRGGSSWSRRGLPLLGSTLAPEGEPCTGL